VGREPVRQASALQNILDVQCPEDGISMSLRNSGIYVHVRTAGATGKTDMDTASAAETSNLTCEVLKLGLLLLLLK
jgi:hypothetical protein